MGKGKGGYSYLVKKSDEEKYYVVKQISGEDARSYQTFWNGHKRYFGQLLPAGKYTLVLKATDKEGRERILKRQLVLKEAPVQEKPVKKTEKEVLKSEAEKAAKVAQDEKNKTLDYTQKRLWTKPGKQRMKGVFDEIEDEFGEAKDLKVEYGDGATPDDSNNIAEMPKDISAEPSASSAPVANTTGTAANNPYDNPYATSDEDDGAYSDDF